MGEEIQKEHFEQADYDRFQQRLEQETEWLRSLFAKGAFDNSSRMLGYELELCLADDNGNPSKTNTRIIDATGNPLFTTELARFNMEINGNVKVRYDDAYELTTGRLLYDRDKELIHTAAKLLVEGDGIILKGQGMRLEMAKRTLTILSHIETTLEGTVSFGDQRQRAS